MLALDALKAFWIFGVFLAMFCWLPARLFSRRPNSRRVLLIAGNWVRAVLGVTVLVFLLSSLRVLGVITVVFLLGGTIGVCWIREGPGMPHSLLASLQAATINLIRRVESRSFSLFFPASKRSPTSARQPWRLRANAWLRAL